jgi:16S rRNA G966 N2-methylase RsmD
VLDKNVSNLSNIIYDSQYLGKIRALNMDIVKYIVDTPDFKNIDLLFLDPPWGGPGYLENTAIELHLIKITPIIEKYQFLMNKDNL